MKLVDVEKMFTIRINEEQLEGLLYTISKYIDTPECCHEIPSRYKEILDLKRWLEEFQEISNDC